MEITDDKSPVVVGSSIASKEVKSAKGDRTMATIEDDDERLLNQIGYTQVRLPER